MKHNFKIGKILDKLTRTYRSETNLTNKSKNWEQSKPYTNPKYIPKKKYFARNIHGKCWDVDFDPGKMHSTAQLGECYDD